MQHCPCLGNCRLLLVQSCDLVGGDIVKEGNPLNVLRLNKRLILQKMQLFPDQGGQQLRGRVDSLCQ